MPPKGPLAAMSFLMLEVRDIEVRGHLTDWAALPVG